MKKRISIQKKIFHRYVTLIISVAVILLMVIYFSYLNELSKQAAENLEKITVSLKKELELKFNQIDSLQNRILTSGKIEEILFTDESQYTDEVKKQELYQELEQLSNLVCGPDDSNLQINYWNTNGGCVGVGHSQYIDYRPGEIMSKKYFQELVKKDNAKAIAPPHSVLWGEKKELVMSVFRVLKKERTDEAVILEVQISCQEVDDLIRKKLEITEKEEEDYSIIIWNNENFGVYTADELEHDLEFYKKTVDKSDKEKGGKKGKVEIDGTTLMFYKEYSEFLDWNLWVFQNKTIYMQPIVDMTFVLIFITCLIIFCLWMVTKKLTQELVSPVLCIHKKLTSLDLQSLNEIEHSEIEGDIKELIELNDAFEQMCKQLKESKDKLELSYVKEVQSKLLAMQSQMNPHFLYNVLSIIKIMGMEADRQEIVEVCTELSMMLRYVSAFDCSLVTICQEKEYTLNYLKLMSVRFQEYLEYELDISEEMNEIQLPRLVLQPLVENSIKYTTEIRPPWKIKVKGWVDGNKWYLSVWDNGPGMNEEKEKELKKNMKKSRIEQHSEKSEIGGMGMLNIYSRLALVYGEEAVFRIENKVGNGLLIVIGGTLDE